MHLALLAFEEVGVEIFLAKINDHTSECRFGEMSQVENFSAILTLKKSYEHDFRR